jgi:hypothetical protein
MRTVLAVLGAWIVSVMFVLMIQGGIGAVAPSLFELSQQGSMLPWALVLLVFGDVIAATAAGYTAAWIGGRQARRSIWVTMILLTLMRAASVFLMGVNHPSALASTLSAFLIPFSVLLGGRIRLQTAPPKSEQRTAHNAHLPLDDTETQSPAEDDTTLPPTEHDERQQ